MLKPITDYGLPWKTTKVGGEGVQGTEKKFFFLRELLVVGGVTLEVFGGKSQSRTGQSINNGVIDLLLNLVNSTTLRGSYGSTARS